MAYISNSLLISRRSTKERISLILSIPENFLYAPQAPVTGIIGPRGRTTRDTYKEVTGLRRDVMTIITQGVTRTMVLQARVWVIVMKIGVILLTNDEGIEHYFIYCLAWIISL